MQHGAFRRPDRGCLVLAVLRQSSLMRLSSTSSSGVSAGTTTPSATSTSVTSLTIGAPPRASTPPPPTLTKPTRAWTVTTTSKSFGDSAFGAAPSRALKSSWLQRQCDEARRLPSRNALPGDAVHSGPVTQEIVFIISLSYCWATREHTDPENKLLADVCDVLKYFDASKHFGDLKEFNRDTNIGEREVLVFWDYPCLYQKGDTSTNGVTLLQRDSFDRGPTQSTSSTVTWGR